MRQIIKKIAGVQCTSFKDKEKNLQKSITIIKDCGQKKVDLIVFPELYSSGYHMGQDYLLCNAESMNGNFINSIKKCAKENHVAVLMPFLEKRENNIYNSVAVVDNEGSLKGIKRKAINWKTELNFIVEANLEENLDVFEVNGVKIGILICYEASFPELSRILADKCAELIIVTAFWGKWALNHWETQLKARALDNNLFLLGVNGLQNRKTCGNTMVISPKGDIINKLNLEEGVLIQEINMDDIYSIRQKIPYYQDYQKYIAKKLYM